MARTLVLILLFSFVVPAFAKPHNVKQPISCDTLWPAVTETLGNATNYKIIAVDNEELKANFIIVGALFSHMDLVKLKQRTTGCDLQLRIGFTGSDDKAAFRKRVNRALKGLQAAKTAAHPAAPGPAE